MSALSPAGKAVLKQLQVRPTWDGDLISKAGRTELVSLGLAERGTRMGCAGMNWLTAEGHTLAEDKFGCRFNGEIRS